MSETMGRGGGVPGLASWHPLAAPPTPRGPHWTPRPRPWGGSIGQGLGVCGHMRFATGTELVPAWPLRPYSIVKLGPNPGPFSPAHVAHGAGTGPQNRRFNQIDPGDQHNQKISLRDERKSKFLPPPAIAPLRALACAQGKRCPPPPAST